MPWRAPPIVDFDKEPQYSWPFWEVGCQAEDLFGELHERFNTTPYPAYIQDPESFHRDVFEIAREAHNKDDFFARMQKRRDERFAELDRFRRRLFMLHTYGFSQLDNEQEFRLMRMNIFASLDSIVAFYASLLGPDETGKEPSLDFFMSSRQQGILRDKEKRLGSCDVPSKPSRATAEAMDPDSSDKSMMPTPPGRRTASPTETRPAAQPSSFGDKDGEPVACSSKRKASRSVESDQRHNVKRQRTDADKSPLTPPKTDTSAVDQETPPFPVMDPTTGAAAIDPGIRKPDTLLGEPDASHGCKNETCRQAQHRAPQPSTTVTTDHKEEAVGYSESFRPKDHGCLGRSGPVKAKRNASRRRSPPRRSGRIAARQGRSQRE